MRFKSLPLSVKAAPRTSSRSPRPSGDRGGRRRRDWIATIPIILLIPALLLVDGQAGAGTTVLRAPSQAVAGERIVVTGRNLPRNARVQIIWDGWVRGMPSARTNSRGDLRVQLTVPRQSSAGQHTLAVVRSNRGRIQTSLSSAWRRMALASTRITRSHTVHRRAASAGRGGADRSHARGSRRRSRPRRRLRQRPRQPCRPRFLRPRHRPPFLPRRHLPQLPCGPSGSGAVGSILVSRDRLMSLPTSGAAWQAMVNEANGFSGVNLNNQDDNNDVKLLAWALVTARTGGDVGPIYQALSRVPGTEGDSMLALGRNLAPVVLAADLVGYRDPGLRQLAAWRHARQPRRAYADLDARGSSQQLGHACRREPYRGGPLPRRHCRPWASGGGLPRLARRAIGVRRVQLRRARLAVEPVGAGRHQPAGATINGHSVDGVLPDDQRRCRRVHVATARGELRLRGAPGCASSRPSCCPGPGTRPTSGATRALARAYAWLHNVAAFPAEGDDSWQPHLVNARYGTAYPGPVPSRSGEGLRLRRLALPLTDR